MLATRSSALWGLRRCSLGMQYFNCEDHVRPGMESGQSSRHRIRCLETGGLIIVKVIVECVICNETFESDDSLLLPEHPDRKVTNVTCIGSNRKGRKIRVVPVS